MAIQQPTEDMPVGINNYHNQPPNNAHIQPGFGVQHQSADAASNPNEYMRRKFFNSPFEVLPAQQQQPVNQHLIQRQAVQQPQEPANQQLVQRQAVQQPQEPANQQLVQRQAVQQPQEPVNQKQSSPAVQQARFHGQPAGHQTAGHWQQFADHPTHALPDSSGVPSSSARNGGPVMPQQQHHQQYGSNHQQQGYPVGQGQMHGYRQRNCPPAQVRNNAPQRAHCKLGLKPVSRAFTAQQSPQLRQFDQTAGQVQTGQRPFPAAPANNDILPATGDANQLNPPPTRYHQLQNHPGQVQQAPAQMQSNHPALGIDTHNYHNVPPSTGRYPGPQQRNNAMMVHHNQQQLRQVHPAQGQIQANQQAHYSGAQGYTAAATRYPRPRFRSTLLTQNSQQQQFLDNQNPGRMQQRFSLYPPVRSNLSSSNRNSSAIMNCPPGPQNQPIPLSKPQQAGQGAGSKQSVKNRSSSPLRPYNYTNKHKNCVVCNDKANGYHYGSPTCEGCKGFFRRTVMSNTTYDCKKFDEQCSITRSTRSNCPSCRFKRCVECGMDRTLVRTERRKRAKGKNGARNGSTRTRPPEPTCSDEVKMLIKVVVEEHVRSHPPIDFEDRYRMLSPEAPVPAPSPNLSINLEMWGNFVNLVSECLHNITQFARGIPGFSQLIEYDKVILLRHSCLEIMALRLCTRYRPVPNNLIFPDGLLLSREQLRLCGCGDMAERLHQFALSLSEVDINVSEMGILSALSLISSDRPGLRHPELVEKIQDELAQGLQYYMHQRHPNTSHTAFPNLLMKLSRLRNIGESGMKRVAELKQELPEGTSMTPVMLEFFNW